MIVENFYTAGTIPVCKMELKNFIKNIRQFLGKYLSMVYATSVVPATDLKLINLGVLCQFSSEISELTSWYNGL